MRLKDGADLLGPGGRGLRVSQALRFSHQGPLGQVATGLVLLEWKPWGRGRGHWGSPGLRLVHRTEAPQAGVWGG